MPDMETKLHFYTSAEVAELLRLNAQVVARKIKAGEIPAYRIGKEWRVERGQLLAWLERHSNQRARTRDDKVIETFFDAGGRLVRIPAQRSKRETVYDRITESFAPDRTYRETEVNATLRSFHDDVATIRRELVATKRLVRTKAGVYKRASRPEPALRRA